MDTKIESYLSVQSKLKDYKNAIWQNYEQEDGAFPTNKHIYKILSIVNRN